MTKETVDNRSEFEKTLVIVRAQIKAAKELKLVETEAVTGFSYFMGKKRLCKILKTKRGVVLELNVQLPKDKFKELPELESISIAQAHKKHLGTMKHLYRAADAKHVGAIMVEAILAFKAVVAADKEKDKEVEVVAATKEVEVVEEVKAIEEVPATDVVEEVKATEETQIILVEQSA